MCTTSVVAAVSGKKRSLLLNSGHKGRVGGGGGKELKKREMCAFLISHTDALSAADVYVRFFGAGLERLQQLLDALTDDGQIVRQHVYRVNNDTDAFLTLQRLSNRSDEAPKHILIDLPTSMTERLLNQQVCRSAKSKCPYISRVKCAP
jgi:hypothetical protein